MSFIYPSSYPFTLCSPLAENVFPPTFVPTFSVNPQPINPELQPLLTPGHAMYCHIFRLWHMSLLPVWEATLSFYTQKTTTPLISWSNVMSSVKPFLTPQPGPHLCLSTPRSQSQHFPCGLETTYLHLSSPPVREHLQEGLTSAHLFFYLKAQYRT